MEASLSECVLLSSRSLSFGSSIGEGGCSVGAKVASSGGS